MAETLTTDVRRFSTRLRRCALIGKREYGRLWKKIFQGGRELVVGQAEYGRIHKRRFHELFNAVALLLEGREDPRLLEFGVSEFSALYREFFPGCRLDLADRPTAAGYPGFNEAVARRLSGCDNFYAVDLAAPDGLAGHDGLPRGAYDVVVFTEVLEHLVVNPVELLAGLLTLLKPGGTVYLTTPNFLSWRNRLLLDQEENPQAVYPQAGGNWDAHHHYREYCAKEMLRFIDQAGGRLTGFYLSDCWDVGEQAQQRIAARPEEKSNLVFTFRQELSRFRTGPPACPGEG